MELVKESIKNLKEYKTNKIDFKIKLDANEGKNILLQDIYKEGIKFNEDFNLNFYPDNDAYLLKQEIKKYLNVDTSNIIAGNGSSEMIELVIKTFVDKGEIILSPIPTFSMYSVFSQIYSAQFIGIQSNEDFKVDIDKLIEKSNELNPKVIFICNPNNPTGNLINKNDIKKLLENTNGLVVVDEAYMEFAEGSMVDEISNYENLIVLRTLSKALGLAGIRLGYMTANQKIIDVINKVKSPYNLNAISQYIGVKALKNKDKIFEYIEEVKNEREFLYKELNEMKIKAYKSYANFIFFKWDINNLYEKLIDYGILIRKFSDELEGYYRVSVGNKNENERFIKILKEIIENEKS
ncbi:histidinol-phosphate transaminase [Tepidibacter hydrothermalis]|uniref:Histidinol-phosphate aminotransferase n=1 Tax=Tepidibacter hydrothermalis TaxID=3036126 RepID=A0ABY8EJJ3_9FIRM|nr:histidinol-phosphate transaminase [Tepidibacter hydrothermalis]WFD11158.1 histidinol-phosphate transaminase [Tepidibacter hydrothermalis]